MSTTDTKPRSTWHDAGNGVWEERIHLRYEDERGEDRVFFALRDYYERVEKPKFCNHGGGGYNGCADSWHVGGNYGSRVCQNPNHHEAETE